MRLKKYVLLIISIVVVIAIIIFLGYHNLKQQEVTNKFFVDESVPVIVGTWNPNELVKIAAPELYQLAPHNWIQNIFQYCSNRLGNLKQYNGSSYSNIRLFFSFKDGLVVSYIYMVNAVFQKGTAQIRVGAITNHNQHYITEFYVTSNTFMATQ